LRQVTTKKAKAAIEQSEKPLVTNPVDPPNAKATPRLSQPPRKPPGVGLAQGHPQQTQPAASGGGAEEKKSEVMRRSAPAWQQDPSFAFLLQVPLHSHC